MICILWQKLKITFLFLYRLIIKNKRVEELVDFNSFVRKVRQKHSWEFEAMDLQKKVNQSIMDRISANEDDGPSVVLASIFSRACYSFESSVILFERGLLADAISCVRNLLETTFFIVAINKQNYLHQRWTQRDWFFQKRVFTQTKKFSKYYKEYSSEEEIDMLIEGTEKKISENNAKDSGIDFWADKAGMVEEYRIDYPQWCQATHSGPRTVEKGSINHDNGKLKEFKFGPITEGMDIPVYRAIHYMRLIFNSTTDHFHIKATTDEIEMMLKINQLSQSVAS